MFCHNLNLGLTTKAKACKVVNQEGNLGATSHAPENVGECERIWENVREWTFTLPNEFPLWELESRWTPKSLENDFKGQNPLD
jgi:hypothetical protein